MPYHCMSGDNSTRLRPTNYKYYFKEEKRPAAHICHCHELYPHPAWCRHTKDSYMKGHMVKTKKKIILYLKKKKSVKTFFNKTVLLLLKKIFGTLMKSKLFLPHVCRLVDFHWTEWM